MPKITLKSTLLACLISFSSMAMAQLKLDYGFYDSLTVKGISNQVLPQAWVGGFNAPQFSGFDANNDGLMDLFVFERDGYAARVFIAHLDSASNLVYHLSRSYSAMMPPMAEYAVLKDMNCDGKPDLVTALNTNIRILLNTSTDSTLSFRQKTNFPFYFKQNGVIQNAYDVPYVTTTYFNGMPNEISTNVDMPSSDIPGLADVDDDGDIDFLHFGSSGTTVYWQKNLSVERYGVCDSLVFEYASSCWGKFSEGVVTNNIFLNVNCREPDYESILDRHLNPKANAAARHTGSSLTMINLNGDSLYDLILGDIGYFNLNAVINGGSKNQAFMIDKDTSFPFYDSPVDIEIFPAAYYLDVDNDSVQELIVAPNEDNISINTNNVWLYENDGANDNPLFRRTQTDFLVGDMLDFGAGTNPVFVDWNGDSLLDIVVGNFGVFGGAGSFRSSMYLLLNTGAKQLPKFTLVDTNFMNLNGGAKLDLSPAFGDLDGDGDLDLVVGDNDGELRFFARDAIGSYNLTSIFGSGLDVGQHARPTIYDVDGDGQNDLVVGNRNGRLTLYRNTGSPGLASFSEANKITNWGGVNVAGPLGIGYASPVFLRLDTNGSEVDTANVAIQTYLYVGATNGYVYAYTDIEQNLGGNFTLVDSMFTGLSRISIHAADLTANGKPDLLVGNQLGGLSIMMKDFGFRPIAPIDTSGTSVSPLISSKGLLQITPNPASTQFIVDYKGPQGQLANAALLSLSGQTVLQSNQKIPTNSITLDVTSLPAGVYLLQSTLSSGEQMMHKVLIAR